jgi:tetratricopeptide (TPR) repeat protein
MPILLRRYIAVVLVAGVLPGTRAHGQTSDPLAALEQTIAAAEQSLREGERQIAESRYRDALGHGWMLLGGLDAGEERFDAAMRAFERASTVTVEPGDALRSLALVHLQIGRAGDAVALLARQVRRHAGDVASRRLLAQALVTNGQPAEAVQELEEALGEAPGDPEIQFVLATGYLRVGRADAADRLFAEVAKARPLPQTHVLIGRAYRDAGELGRARTALREALRMDPRVRRAHYYLATVTLREHGIARLEEAIHDLQQELTIAADDPVTSLRLGIALTLAQRHAEALPVLERIVRSSPATAQAFHYLGRCQLALDRPADAVRSLRRALELSGAAGQAGATDDLSIHYQLAVALRAAGAGDEAAAHFEAAARASVRRAHLAREELTRNQADAADPGDATARPPLDVLFPFATLEPRQRAALRQRLSNRLAQVYLNLGIMQAQARRFERAVDLLRQAADLAPAFPQVHYSLGVAYFNAGQYDRAAETLAQALATNPADAAAQRMLALAWLNGGAPEKAAELLRNDPGRDGDPSLQLAYGLALVRSDRGHDAEILFSRLLAEHGDSPELNVVLGQAHAQQGDFDEAVAALERAIRVKPDIVEAHASLGHIYLRQGRLPEAARALRAELLVNPGDLGTRQTLATVLELQGEPDEALTLLRSVLRAKPDRADARYLLGKILLSQGASVEAAEHLEAAARFAPDDANVRYQLGQAYQKLGRTADAEQQFAVFRRLKDTRGGRTP